MEADVLSQDEVDALLEGVEDTPAGAGDAPGSGGGPVDDPILSAFPDLYAGAASPAAAAPAGEVELDPWLSGFSDIAAAEQQAQAAAAAANPATAAEAGSASASGTAGAGSANAGSSSASSTGAGSATATTPTSTARPGDAPEQLVVTATLTRADLALAAQTEALKLPALERIAENLVAPMVRELRRFLRREPVVSGEPVSFGQWSQVIADTGPSRLLLMTMAPLPGEAVVAIDDALVDLLVEYLFGSEGRYYRAPGEALRAPGHTGTRIASRLLEHLMQAWTLAWEPVYAIAPAAAGGIADPTLFAAPDDAVFGLTLKIGVGERGGQLRILLPLTLLQPVHERLKSGYNAPPAPPSSDWSLRLLQGIEAADIELSADLGSTELTLQQVLAMQPGDFIALDVPPTLIATADGEPLLECHYGVAAGRYALRVERLLALPQPESGAPHD